MSINFQVKDCSVKRRVLLKKYSITKITTHASLSRVRNLKFATYLKFATCENTNKINELW